MATLRPFHISIPDARLQRLHSKLALTDFPSELETDIAQPWSRGPPRSEIKQLTQYWLNGFNWRKVEEALNTNFPQFLTTINVRGFGDYDVHFVHLRSNIKNAIPLIFLHGWPGNFYEGTKFSKLLVNSDGKAEPAFHVVMPSLVDHGFSSGSRTVCAFALSHVIDRVLTLRQADFHIDQHAEIAHKLMLQLGYTQYGTSTAHLDSPEQV
jgi:pimeloyl-ACP methyl ester carboxylesterase